MTYREPARRTTRRVRIRWNRVAGLLAVIAAIVAALDYQLLASPSSTASPTSTTSPPVHVPRSQDGPTITLTDADVADTERRRRQEESVVSIAAGEQLTQRQALQALLLPSANNIAAVLARWDAG